MWLAAVKWVGEGVDSAGSGRRGVAGALLPFAFAVVVVAIATAGEQRQQRPLSTLTCPP